MKNYWFLNDFKLLHRRKQLYNYLLVFHFKTYSFHFHYPEFVLFPSYFNIVLQMNKYLFLKKRKKNYKDSYIHENTEKFLFKIKSITILKIEVSLLTTF